MFISYVKKNEETGDKYAGKTSGLTQVDSSKEADRIMSDRERRY